MLGARVVRVMVVSGHMVRCGRGAYMSESLPMVEWDPAGGGRMSDEGLKRRKAAPVSWVTCPLGGGE